MHFRGQSVVTIGAPINEFPFLSNFISLEGSDMVVLFHLCLGLYSSVE